MQTIKELKDKYSKKVLLAIAVLIALVGVVFASKWMAGRDAQQLADSLREKFRQENQAFFDNIAVLKEQNRVLEENYNNQKTVVDTLYANDKVRGKNVFKSKDKAVVASYIDNTLDAYTPDK
jgi:hypothetical protein